MLFKLNLFRSTSLSHMRRMSINHIPTVYNSHKSFFFVKGKGVRVN